MFRVLTLIIKSSYKRNYSFWYWLTGSTTIRSRCWVGTDSCVSYGRYSFVMDFYIHGSVHHESNLITVQQDATYSVYYISVGSSTCFGCRHPSSGARTTVITASGTGQPGLLPSALVVQLELNNSWPVPEAVITVVRAPDDGCQHPKHV